MILHFSLPSLRAVTYPIHLHPPPAYLEPEEEEADLAPPEEISSFFLVDLPFNFGTDTKVGWRIDEWRNELQQKVSE